MDFSSIEFQIAILTSVVSVIIAMISLGGSVLGYIINRNQWKQEMLLKEIELKNILNSQLTQIRTQYSEKLLLKRMELYPELIKMTQEIGYEIGDFKNKSELRLFHEKAYLNLKKWQMDNGGTLYLSEESTKCFYKLLAVLNTKNLDKNLTFDQDKIKSIKDKKNMFRISLHNDLNILQKNHDNLTKILSDNEIL